MEIVFLIPPIVYIKNKLLITVPVQPWSFDVHELIHISGTDNYDTYSAFCDP